LYSNSSPLNSNCFLHIMEVDTGTTICNLQRNMVIVSCSFFDNNRYVIFAVKQAKDNSTAFPVTVMNVSTMEFTEKFVLNKEVNAIQVNNDRTIVCGSQGAQIKIWDFVSGTHIRSLEGANHEITSFIISADAKYIVSSCNKVRVWDVATGTCIRFYPGTPYYCGIFHFNTYICSVVINKLKIWNVFTGEAVTTMDKGKTIIYDFSPNSKYVITHYGSYALHVKNVKANKSVMEIINDSSIVMAQFSGDGKSIVILQESEIKLIPFNFD